MPLGPATYAPQGFVYFCRKLPKECAPALPAEAPYNETPDRIAEIIAQVQGATSSIGSGAPAISDPAPVAQDDAPVSSWLHKRPLRLIPDRITVSYAQIVTLTPAVETSPAPAAAGSGASARIDISETMTAVGALRKAGLVTRTGAPQLAAGPIELTPKLWKLVAATNAQVNRAIIRQTDWQTYGVEEDWSLPIEAGVRYGDCEDYALEKRHALIKAGVPRSALSLAVVLTPRGERHAVLVLSTDRGDYVLDSLSPWIVPWRQSGYRWLERQVAGARDHWVMVADPANGVQQAKSNGRESLIIAL